MGRTPVETPGKLLPLPSWGSHNARKAPFGGNYAGIELLFHSRSIAVSYSSDGYTFESVINCVEILYFVFDIVVSVRRFILLV